MPIRVKNTTTGDLWQWLHELFPPQTIRRQKIRMHLTLTLWKWCLKNNWKQLRDRNQASGNSQEAFVWTTVSLKVTELSWTLASSSPRRSPKMGSAEGQSQASTQECAGQRPIGSTEKLLGGVLGTLGGSKKVREGVTIRPEVSSSK